MKCLLILSLWSSERICCVESRVSTSYMAGSSFYISIRFSLINTRNWTKNHVPIFLLHFFFFVRFWKYNQFRSKLRYNRASRLIICPKSIHLKNLYFFFFHSHYIPCPAKRTIVLNICKSSQTNKKLMFFLSCRVEPIFFFKLWNLPHSTYSCVLQSGTFVWF